VRFADASWRPRKSLIELLAEGASVTA
jgi:hypothetical protein